MIFPAEKNKGGGGVLQEQRKEKQFFVNLMVCIFSA